LALYDRTKKAEPTAKEKAHWEELAAAEVERMRKIRKEQADGRRSAEDTSKLRSLDQFRR
jgi:hypothetical protein